MAKKKPAYGYTRVSSQSQTDGHGPERQKQAIKRWASRNGYTITDVFSDAHTGTEEDRPGFSEMLSAIRANGIKTVIIESMDRLARSLSVQLALTTVLDENGVALISANTGEDVTAAMRDDPMREAMVLMQGVFAQTEKKLLVNKLRRAREAVRKAKGRCEGVRPYGETPEEQEAVKRLRQLARKPRKGKRRSLREIARILTEEGHATRSGRPWAATTVHGILRRKRR